MGKKVENELPKLEDWLAPWEKDKDGNAIPEDEQKLDPAQLKKYLHGLLGDKTRLRTQLDDTTAEAEELQQKVVDAKSPAELKALQEENVRLVKERDEAKQKASSNSDSDQRAIRLEIALEKGLTKRQALRLVGTTKEELEEDADELIKEFGGAGEPNEETGDQIARGPKRRVVNGGDRSQDKDVKDDKPIDYAEIVRQKLANR